MIDFTPVQTVEVEARAIEVGNVVLLGPPNSPDHCTVVEARFHDNYRVVTYIGDRGQRGEAYLRGDVKFQIVTD